MDANRVRTVYGWIINIANNPNCMTFPITPSDIQNIKNGLIKISHDIERESPYFSQELFEMKDRMIASYQERCKYKGFQTRQNKTELSHYAKGRPVKTTGGLFAWKARKEAEIF